MDAGYKGDLARTYFYMLTCYRDKNLAQTAESQVMVSYTNNVAEFTPYSVNLLMKWHREDPVSQKERTRNDAIYVHQGNRNPFIDYPCLAEYLWGDSITKEVDFSKLVSSYDASFTGQGCPCELTTDPTLTSPSAGTLNFTAIPNGTNTQTITVKGINLTQDITLTLSGTNAALFGLSSTSATSAEGLAGKAITITYSPTAEGSHTATLTISSAEFTSVVLTLNGTCSNTVVAPSITTPIYNQGSAGANITSFGGAVSLTENGIYYSTTSGFADGAGTKLTATTAATTGSFSIDVTTLPVGTYYFKGFATNSAGTTYSTQSSFTITEAVQAGLNPNLVMGTLVTNDITFGTANSKELFIQVSNVTSDITITLTNNNGNYKFSTENTTTITLTAAEATAGKRITLTRNAGNNNATLTISGNGVNKVHNIGGN